MNNKLIRDLSCFVLLFGSATVVCAADSNASGQGAPASAQPAAATVKAPPTRDSVVVKKGDTLDKVVARSLGDLPFRQDVLRRALLEKNRVIFKDGKPPRRLPPGAVLQVPLLDDFRRIVFGDAACRPAEENTQTDSPQIAEAPQPAEGVDSRKAWVRYP